MKKICLLCLFFVQLHAWAQSPDCAWLNNYGNDGRGTNITADKNGYIYMTGTFNNTFTANSTPVTFGSQTLTNCSTVSGGNSSFFIVKSDSNGHIIWTRTACGSFNSIQPTSIKTDIYGNIIVAGYASADSIIIQGVKLKYQWWNSTNNFFLIKFDQNGNALWGKAGRTTLNGSGGGTTIKSIATDSLGNIYAGGYFSASNMIIDNDTINSNSIVAPDMFLLKYDSSGHTIWHKSFGGNDEDEINAIDVNSTTIVATGYFYSDSIKFDNYTIHNDLNINSGFNQLLFIAKFDTAGHCKWVLANKSVGAEGSDIKLSPTQSIYVVGDFSSPFIRLGNDSIVNTGIFITSLDSAGNYNWAKGGNGFTTNINHCATDTAGNLLVIGVKVDSTFIFLEKYSPTGKQQWMKLFGGGNSFNDIGSDIAVHNGSVYIVGTQFGQNLELGNHIASLHAGSGEDIFFAKLAGICNGVTMQQFTSTFQPQIGMSDTFHVAASGTLPIAYQWYKNNFPISGAINSSYFTPVITATDNNTRYFCTVANCNYSNSFNTLPDTILFCRGGKISQQPTNQYFVPGDSATFKIFYSGVMPESFFWYQIIPGNTFISNTDSVFTISSLTIADTADLICCSMNYCNHTVHVLSDTVRLFLGTGIKTLNKLNQSIEIYPNPCENNLSVSGIQFSANTKLEVMNMLGQNVYCKMTVMNADNCQLNTENLPSGIYFLQTVDDNGFKHTTKFVEQ